MQIVIFRAILRQKFQLTSIEEGLIYLWMSKNLIYMDSFVNYKQLKMTNFGVKLLKYLYSDLLIFY